MTTTNINEFKLKSFSLNEEQVYNWSIIYTLNGIDQKEYSPTWWFKTKKLADLAIKDVKFPPDSVLPGSEFSISWLVTNIGNSVTSSSFWYDEIYGSETNNFKQSRYLGSAIQIRYLEPLGFYRAEFKLSLPERFKLSNYFLWIVVDKNNYLEDSNRANNQYANIISVARLPLPNLVVKSLILSLEQPKAGKSLELKYTVENIGETNAKPNRVWLDRVVFKKSNHVFFQKELSVSFGSGLDVKANYSNSISIKVPTYSYGNGLSFEIVSNFRDDLYESDLNDNGFLKELDVLGPDTPDLNLVRLELNKNELKTGEVLRVSYEVLNEGLEDANEASWLDLCLIKNSRNEVVLSQDMNILGPVLKRASYNRTIEFYLQKSLSDGEYTVELRVDNFNRIFVYNPSSSSIRSTTTSVKIIRSIPTWELRDSAITATRVNVKNTVAYRVDISYRLLIRDELNSSGGILKWTDEFYFSYLSVLNINSAIKLGETSRNTNSTALNASSSFIFFDDDVWNGNLFAYFAIDSGNLYEKVNIFSNPYRLPIVLEKIVSTLNLTEFRIGNLSLEGEVYKVMFGFTLKNNGPKLVKSARFDVFIRNSLNQAWTKANDFKLEYDLEMTKEYRIESSIGVSKNFNGQLYMKVEASNKFDFILVAAEFNITATGTVNNSTSTIIEQVI